MITRSLLAIAITAASAQAVYAAPFMPMDARGLAMGNTGVATAKLAHAPAYNPSLLAQAREKDDFALLFPQIGVMAGDEAEITDTAQDIADVTFKKFENAVGDNTQGLEKSIDDLNAAVNDLLTAINAFDSTNAGTTTASVTAIQAANTTLQGTYGNVNSDLNLTQSSVIELTNSLKAISGNPLNARLGVAGGIAIPSKKLAVAVSVQGSANISAKVNFSDKDTSLLGQYIPAAQGLIGQAEAVSTTIDGLDATTVTPATITQLQADVTGLQGYGYTTPDGVKIFENGVLASAAQDPDLSSTAQVVAVAVADVGLSFAREFDIKDRKIAIGITPKLQKISTFHYADEIDGFEDVESDDLKDSQRDYTKFNLDIGASYRFGESNNWMVGVVGKNLLGGTFDYADIMVTPTKKDEFDNVVVTGAPYAVSGGSVSLKPQFRAGVGYLSKWVNLALDVDLTENKPVAFEAPTQYVAVGAELDVFSFLQLRLGYRTNMAENGVDVASVGLGLSPFGVHIDIAAMANPSEPKKEAGVALETGFYF